MIYLKFVTTLFLKLILNVSLPTSLYYAIGGVSIVKSIVIFVFRERRVSHKTSALGDFAVQLSIQLCQISHYASALGAAHVVPCIHVGFKHRMRAGASVMQAHWRRNKHKQQALSCLEVSLIPMDVSCAIFPCVHNTHTAVNPCPPNGTTAPPLRPPIPYSLPAPLCMSAGSGCDKWPSSRSRWTLRLCQGYYV